MKSMAWTLLLMSVVTCVALGQAAPAPTTPPAGEENGKPWAGYRVQQSFEFGYRFSEINGNGDLYNTYLNQHTGFRLLNQSLSMRSENGAGVLFDDLTASSFGWGGDPENAARLRISKRGWYDFSAQFRRDQNFFDYDLLANPLNPTSTKPTVPTVVVGVSPHSFFVRRRMYDFNLAMMPDAKVSVRLGYSRNRSEGPSFSSFHEGTDVLLNQPWNVTSNQFRIGLDFKLLPKTVISYDQGIDFDKNDTDNSLAPFAAFPLANGTLVSLGLPWSTVANTPCAAPFTASGKVNPSCNGYYSYTRTQRVRTTTPTEQLTWKSDFKRVSFVARAAYSSANMDNPYFEFFDGLVSRTGERQFTFSGPASTRRVYSSVDAALTVQLTDKIALSDSFRFDNLRAPGIWTESDTATSGVATGTPATINLLSPLGATTTESLLNAVFLGQKSYYNVLQVAVNTGKHAGFHAGIKFRRRLTFHADPEVFDLTSTEDTGFEGFEGDRIEVNEVGPIAGIWLRPSDHLRINADLELMTADNFITRISPRQRQNYRVRTTYRPKRWASLSASANIWESRNGEADTKYRQHYRSFGTTLSLLPSERFGLDLSYNFTDALQNAYMCFNGTYLPVGTVVNACPTYDATNSTTIAANPNPNWIYSTYVSNVHYGSALLNFKPLKKLTANLGYSMTYADGSITNLNVLQPRGSLQFSYPQPQAGLSYEVVKNASLNAYWNYDQYSEPSFTGPTFPRYFHDNRTVVSMRYAF